MFDVANIKGLDVKNVIKIILFIEFYDATGMGCMTLSMEHSYAN